MSLVERGTLELGTTARSLLGDDLPLIADDVTIEHLLAHRSGIGDYLDEDAVDDITDYVMPVPVHELATTEQFLPVLDGHADRVPGRRAVRVQQRRLRRARTAGRAGERRGLPRAGSHPGLRACGHGRHRVPALRRAARDAPPWATWPSTACGRTCSTSPCSATATAASTRRLPTSSAFWDVALRRTDRLAGAGRRDGATAQRLARGVRSVTASASTSTRRPTRSGSRDTTPACRSPACTSPRHRSTYTVISNWSDGAWPIVRLLNDRLGS